ncbi:DegT/DnrJ/EryC1/StrS family aminotransferase [Bordetella muralis]|uniref:DegT/DnrJ/EryC1/StrS family aminotransferase n=1 Tax=Bordetella muralis TaxID=1649130 RepID=UPI0039EFF8E0
MTIHYPLATTTWDDAEYAAIQRVVESGMFTMGKEVLEFEKRFASFVGSQYAVMVNSGSSANLLMIAALFFKKESPLARGDEVIVPAVSWSTTYYPLQQYGLKVKFVDVDAKTLNFNLADLREAVSANTRAILAVNLLGNPNDFSAIREIIGDRDIILLEDNCESLGATLGGTQAGTFGLMGTFSSFFSHHIATMEGGVLVTDDEELYHISLCLRAHGWTRNLPQNNLVCGTKSDNAFEESFRFVLPGYNFRPLEMSGAIGIEQLKKLPSIISGRRKNAERFQALFRNHPWLGIQEEIGESSWFGFALIIKPDANVDRINLMKKLEHARVDVRPIVAGNFAKNEVLKWFDYTSVGNLDVASYIDEKGFFVGNHHYDVSNELEYVRNLCE